MRAKATPDRPLTAAQTVALDALLDGATVSEAAKRAGVTRQTCSEWKNHNPAFVAALTLAMRDRLSHAHSGIIGLVPQAVRVLEDDLEAGGERASQAARDILRFLEQVGPVDTSTSIPAPVDDHPWPDLREWALQSMKTWTPEERERAGVVLDEDGEVIRVG